MTVKLKRPKIVVIGGGTGVFTVLSGLRNYPVDLTAVVSMADNGGSSGILREEFGILPPGDIRRALVALAGARAGLLADLFNYRFKEGGLNGHSFGNIMLTALERICGGFEKAVDAAGRVLEVRGRVLPVTLDNIQLEARLENGRIIRGETNIDFPRHDGRLRISKISLQPAARLNPKVRRALLEADLIVIGPGDLFTSIIPNIITEGMRQTLCQSKAGKVYVVNVMTKWGETHGFGAEDFVETIEKYMGSGLLEYAIINTALPSRARLARYGEERSQAVRFALSKSRRKPRPITGDFLRSRGFLRHDPEKLARAIFKLV